MRELNWSSSFVDYEPTHSWWFTRKSVRNRAAVLRLAVCSLREETPFRFPDSDHPSELAIPLPAPLYVTDQNGHISAAMGFPPFSYGPS